MGIDINRFNAAKERARKMIHNDAKQDSAIIKERQEDRERTYRSLKGVGTAMPTGFDNVAPSYGSKGSSLSTINESYNDNSNEALYSDIDNKMNAFIQTHMENKSAVPNSIPSTVNSKLPPEIIKSFSDNYIDTSKLNNVSVLDTIGASEQPKQHIVEEYNTQQVLNESGAKIDYELIKNIVESSVKKYINALGKKMLTENKNLNDGEIKAIQFTGNKFIFVDKSGNLYESKLVKKGNVKDKT